MLKKDIYVNKMSMLCLVQNSVYAGGKDLY
jgi:hypothetical protein